MRRNSAQTSGLESAILRQIRAGDGLSRVALARALGLAPSTAGIYVERLLADGFLVESAQTRRDAGRPPRLLRPNPAGGEFIGVDFEARHIMAVAVDFSDRPLRNAHRLIDEGDSVKQIFRKIEEAISEVRPRGSRRLLAIGVGVPGIVDAARGVAVHYKYIAHWQEVPLAARLRQRFSVPVFLENNARSMALAEMWFGQGRSTRDFLCVSVRSGIGVGLVLNGQLQRGSQWRAGELGRWRTRPPARDTAPWFAAVAENSPAAPELQEIASVRSIQLALMAAIASGARSVLRPTAAGVSVTNLVQAAQQRDALTLRILGAAAEALGAAIGQLTLVLDPVRVILAGPLTSLGEAFLEPVRRAAGRELQASAQPAPEIVNSGMGDFCGALGAAALALHEWKPTPAAHPKSAPAPGPAAAPSRAARRRRQPAPSSP
jgi:glucokinase